MYWITEPPLPPPLPPNIREGSQVLLALLSQLRESLYSAPLDLSRRCMQRQRYSQLLLFRLGKQSHWPSGCRLGSTWSCWWFYQSCSVKENQHVSMLLAVHLTRSHFEVTWQLMKGLACSALFSKGHLWRIQPVLISKTFEKSAKISNKNVQQSTDIRILSGPTHTCYAYRH